MSKQSDDPFYDWLDHEQIRDLVHQARDLEPGERLVLIKGLVPDLVDSLGVAGFEGFLEELQTKARRFEEARTHPGTGQHSRQYPGEALGGPTPQGHRHLSGHREGRHRDRERHQERSAWGDPRG